MDLSAQSDFLLKQRLTLLINRYDYFTYGGGVQGPEVAFAEQKRFTFREHVTVYSDDTKATELFTIHAEKILDIHGKFLIRDAGGDVGYIRKVFGASLLQSTWEICAPDGTVLFIAREKNKIIAVLRRVVSLFHEIGQFIPFNFLFEKDGRKVGYHRRVWGSFTDTYHIHLAPELSAVDRRLVLALGILLDALQAR